MNAAVLTDRVWVFALATLCCLLWGSAYPAIKIGYGLLHIAPTDVASQMLFAGWRFALAGLILLAVTALLKKPVLRLTGRRWRQVGLLGLTQTTIQYVFFYVGLAHATGAKSAILNATGVFFSVALAHFIYADDRLTGRKALGCLIGFLCGILQTIPCAKTDKGVKRVLLGLLRADVFVRRVLINDDKAVLGLGHNIGRRHLAPRDTERMVDGLGNRFGRGFGAAHQGGGEGA